VVKIKICGLTNINDVLNAHFYGADLLGFIFVENTPRYVSDIKNILSYFPLEKRKKVNIVGLFRDTDINYILEKIGGLGFDFVQLHGDESPGYCLLLKEKFKNKFNESIKIIKTFKINKNSLLLNEKYDIIDYEKNIDFFLFDTYHPSLSGGTGLRFDLQCLGKIKQKINKPFFIAGGFNPDNVINAIKEINPYGIDISSGVEKKIGIKDKSLLERFIKNAKHS